MLLNPGFRIGKQGVEKALDLQLRGKPGGQKVEVDAKRPGGARGPRRRHRAASRARRWC